MNEILKKLFGDAVTDDILKQFNTELGKRFVAKSDYNNKTDEIKNLNQKISGFEGQIKTLSENSKNTDGYKQQLESLQIKYNDDTQALQKTIGDLKFNSALDMAITTAGAKSAKALKGVLDMDKIKFDGERLTGFDEQLGDLKKNYSYLFNSEPTSTGMRHGGTSPDADKMSDAEYYAQYYKNKQ